MLPKRLYLLLPLLPLAFSLSHAPTVRRNEAIPVEPSQEPEPDEEYSDEAVENADVPKRESITATSTDANVGWFEYLDMIPVVHSGLPRRQQLREVILSVSFPRTGSTWLYKLLESVTGREGCALYDESRNPAFFGGRVVEDVFAITRTDLKTQKLRPSDNCITKTHFPYIRAADDANVRPSRLIRLVRNPVDAIMSVWDYERRGRFGKGGRNFNGVPSIQNVTTRYL